LVLKPKSRMAECPVCNGSGRLLDDPCPLCEDENTISSKVDSDCNSSLLTHTCRHGCCTGCAQHLCLVLDIDGTLLSEATVEESSMKSMLRPHLHSFLDFAFGCCGAVGIWTAASKDWLDSFMEAIDPNNERQWAFTWSGNRISTQRISPQRFPEGLFMSDRFEYCKRLRKIWRNKGLRKKGYTPSSTLIVDNTESVCCSNYGNAIYIKTFDEDGVTWNSPTDDWLLVLIEYLKHLQKRVHEGRCLRSMEKRGWYAKTIAARFC